MLQFITNATTCSDIINQVQLVIEGGCKWIQLRMKNATKSDIIKVAKEAKILCRDKDVILVIDDEVEIAKGLELDGVHLGKNDMNVIQARKMLGESFIIGATANTLDDIMTLPLNSIDYIGLGPYRYTKTKENLSPIIGVEGYKSIIDSLKQNDITIPIVAIGGITFDDIDQLMCTGINGVAVSGSIIKAGNPTIMTNKIINELKRVSIKNN
jgi:thiamine-phosphate pyrophosphorylase